MFATLTIGQKLLACFSALLLSLAGLSYLSLSAIDSLGRDLDEIANRASRQIDLAGSINESTAAMRGEVRAFVLAAVLKKSGDLEAARASFRNKVETVRGAIHDLHPLVVSHRGLQASGQLESGLSTWNSSFDEMVRLVAAGKVREADDVRVNKQRPIPASMVKASAEIAEMEVRADVRR